MFVLEAKLAPNEWQQVDRVYPEIPQIKSFFRFEDDAKDFKAKLKNVIKQTNGVKENKKPIRIRKVGNMISNPAKQRIDKGGFSPLPSG